MISHLRLVFVICLIFHSVFPDSAGQPSLRPRIQASWPEQGGGQALDVQVIGQYAYVALGAGGLVIFDVSDPKSVKRVGGFQTPGAALRVYVVGQNAFIADGSSGFIHIIDISTPSRPVRVASYNTGDVAAGVRVEGQYAYVANGNSGLKILDVKDVTRPVLIGSYKTDGFADGITLALPYAYVSNGASGIKVLDISTPSRPLLLGSYLTIGWANDIKVADKYAYVASATYLEVLDISDPTHIKRLSLTLNPAAAANGICLSGHYVFVATSNPNLRIFDVTSPAQLVPVADYFTGVGLSANNVVIKENYAYIADGSGGLQIADISVPERPVRIGGIDTGIDAGAVCVAGRYAYVADYSKGLQIIELDDSTGPILLTTFGAAAVGSVNIFNNYAFVGDTLGLAILDVANPGSPALVGRFRTTYGTPSAEFSGQYAYVADGPGGMHVVDIKTPASPVKVGGYQTTGLAKQIRVSGTNAYVVGDRLLILNIDDPKQPKPVVEFKTAGDYTAGIDLLGNYAFIAEGPTGLEVVDVSVPTRPVSKSVYNTHGFATDVRAYGKYVYVTANGGSGVQVLDVSDPRRLVRVGNSPFGGDARAVFVENNRVYVARGERGLLVLYSIPSFQFTISVDNTGGKSFTVEAIESLSDGGEWQPLVSTNSQASYDFVDFNISGAQKLYRVRQP